MGARTLVAATGLWVDRHRQVLACACNRGAQHGALRRSSRPTVKTVHRPDTVYCDPPYLGSTRSRGAGHGGYRHELTDDDHRELAAALADSPAHVPVSGYPSTLCDDLYAGCRRAQRLVHRPTSNRRSASGQRRVEVLCSNRPLAGQPSLEFASGRGQ